jgi:ABC-2 type transport system ATP-binding protein/ABC-2 type transport system permease protein
MTNSSDAAVTVDRLRVRRGGQEVLREVSVVIPRGQVTGLLGPSGCGKTTMLRAIVGAQVITSGIVTVLGHPAGSRELRTRIGYATQTPALYADMTVTECLRYFAAVLRAPRSDVTRVIQDVGLDAQAHQLVGQLSGGQRSRASLAAALLGSPRLLVLDEPTVGLDPVLRDELWELFHRLAASGVTVVVSSHVMDEAARCQRLVLMRHGRIIADDTPDAAPDHWHRRPRPSLPPPGSRRGGARVNPAITWATARRLLTQLRHDPRTVAMLLLMPTLLMVLLRYVFNSDQLFSHLAPSLLGVFPFVIMFMITSITTLRERTTATLERLLTMPLGKLDLLLGYAVAFGLLAVVQVSITGGVALAWLGVTVTGPVWALLLVAVLDALLGMALGLFVSAFARTEFQAMQFMPVFAMPQVLLCGLFTPREHMTDLLHWVSDVMPLSYAIEALNHITTSADLTATFGRDLLIVAGCTLFALVLGAATLQRRTP